MPQTATHPSSHTNLRGVFSIWLAIFIFAAANSVVQLLTQLGATHLIDGRNPISFCNVLFVGNLCAFFVLAYIYRKDCKWQVLRALKMTDWLALVVLAFLSATLAPTLIFLALERTDVINVVLLSRIEPVLFIVLAVFVFGERPNRWTVMALILTLIGVVVALTWQSMGGYNLFGTGEIMVISAACISAISTIVSKIWLKRIPLGVFIVFRTVMVTREVEGCEASPNAGVIGSQSIKTTESGGISGYDAAKKSKTASVIS